MRGRPRVRCPPRKSKEPPSTPGARDEAGLRPMQRALPFLSGEQRRAPASNPRRSCMRSAAAGPPQPSVQAAASQTDRVVLRDQCPRALLKLRDQFARPLLALMAVVGLLLLIAC